MTVWKAVTEFPDYEVSDDGRVRFIGGRRAFGNSWRVAPPGERKLLPHPGGYIQVRLNRVNTYVHRLVAEAFLSPDPVRTYVNHKNGDKTDNRASNLEWCTVRENQLHKTRVIQTGDSGSRVGKRLTKSEFFAIKNSPEPPSVLAPRFGVAQARIYRIKRGLSACYIPDPALTPEDPS